MSALDTVTRIIDAAGAAVDLGTRIADAVPKDMDRRTEMQLIKRIARSRARAARLRSLAAGMRSTSKIRRSRLARAARVSTLADELERLLAGTMRA